MNHFLSQLFLYYFRRMNYILRFVFALFIVTTARAQTIRYDVSFPNAIHHEAEVSLLVSQLPRQTAVFRMSRSSPGRYATHEFGKNVYNVRATDGAGKPLAINRTDGDVYEVANHAGTVKITYTLYGDYPDGTYLGIDPQSVHLNMPAGFMWVKGYDRQPITVRFTPPAGNVGLIATQLIPSADPHTFTAPGLQYFMDSPTKIGKLAVKEWKRTNTNGKPITFRLALEAAVADSTAERLASKLTRIVDQAGAVYGEWPAYDYGSYTFLASLNPYVKGDGMEHRNSTMITLPLAFTGTEDVLGVFAHEFFHCWNVERIRPKTLEPFNFEKSNMSNELWFAEGFTQYYGELLLVRAGFTPIDAYTETLAGALYTKLLTPGARSYSPIDASRHAVFVDAGTSIDRSNYVNMFTSYYPYGAAIALALDLELRGQFNKSLDDYMQAVWKRFGKTEVPYTVEGLASELGRLTNPGFATTFFQKYVYGHESIDYTGLLAKAGFTVTKANPGQAWMGTVRYGETPEGLVIRSNTVKETPLYAAGLDVDDVIKTIDGQAVSKTDALQARLAAHKPGDAVTVTYLHRGEPQTVSVKLAENPSYGVVPVEKAGGTLTPAQQQFRMGWLGAKAVK